jgi:hypothetical protein
MSAGSGNVGYVDDGESIPEWLSALKAYLVRDRDLDQRVRNSDRDLPGSRKHYSGPREHHYWLIRRLAGLFGTNGCTAYRTWLTGGIDLYSFDLEFKGTCPPTNPTPEEESAALRAVLEWLVPTPVSPRSATPKERQELLALLRRARRAATDRLRQLEHETTPPPAGDGEGEIVFGQWRIAPGLAFYNGQELLGLQKRHRGILKALVKGKGRTVMLSTLRLYLSQNATNPDQAIRVYVSQIRKAYRAIAGDSAPDPIEDMDGVGYRLPLTSSK